MRATLAALAAVGALLLAPGHALAKPASVGISDQEPGTYIDPLMTWVGIGQARVIAPWDIGFGDAGPIDRVLSAAHATGRDILVSFEHRSAEDCAGGPCYLPSPAEYRSALAVFHRRWPYVRTISPWNEANHPSQPTAAHPEAAAEYYRIAREVCPDCRVLGAELVDLANMRGWLRRFKAALPTAPRLWGLHNYGDVTRRRSAMTRRLLRSVGGQVWLTETGGLVRFRLRNGVYRWRYDERRAARSVAYTFALAEAHPRIRRVYLYNWRAVPWLRWDSGLLSRAGRPRPSFCVLAARLRPDRALPGRHCRPLPRARVVRRPRYHPRAGGVRATVTCPHAHVVRCGVVMAVRANGRTRSRHGRKRGRRRAGRLLGRQSVRIRPGHTRAVRVRVPRARRRMIRRGRTRVLRAQVWLGRPRPRQYKVRCGPAHRR